MDTPPVRRNSKYIVSLCVFLVLVAFTFGVLLHQIDLEQLVEIILQVNGWYLLGAFCLAMLYLLCEGRAIQVIATSLKQKMRFISGFTYACNDFYFSSITPSASGGQPMAVYYMSRDGVPLSKSSLSFLVHTIVYKVVLLVLGLLVLLFHSDLLFFNGWLLEVLFFIGVVVNLALIVLCLMAMFSRRLARRIVMGLLHLATRLRLVRDPKEKFQYLDNQLKKYQAGALYVKKNPIVPLRVLLYNTVQRVAMFSVSYLVYRSFGLSQFTYWDLLAIQVILALAVDSLPIPGGVAVTEGVFLLLYLPVYGDLLRMPALLLTRGMNYYCCLLVSSMVTLGNHVRLWRRDQKEGKG